MSHTSGYNQEVEAHNKRIETENTADDDIATSLRYIAKNTDRIAAAMEKIVDNHGHVRVGLLG